MLNKNQSNKRNYWKYALVLPLLGAFVFFLQVKVVAQEKESPKQEISNKETPVFIAIEKNTSDKKFDELSNLLEPKYNVTLLFSKIKRNTKEEITAIKVEYKHKDGRSGATEIDGTNPINSFYFFINGDKMGFEEFKSSKNNKNVTVSKYPIPTKDSEKPMITINGKRTKATLEELNKTNQNLIQSVNILKGKDAVAKYGKAGENGVVEIITKKNIDILKSTNK